MKRVLWLIPALLPFSVFFASNGLNSLGSALLPLTGLCCLVAALGLFYGIFKHPATWVVASFFLAVGLFFMDIGIGFFAACVYPG